MPSPTPEELSVLKYLWVVLLAPVTWIINRHNVLSGKIDNISSDMASTMAHTDRTREEVARIHASLGRIEDKMEKRRGDG